MTASLLTQWVPFLLVGFITAPCAYADSAAVCPADNTHTSGAALQRIVDYKRNPHALMAGYFRTWRDRAADSEVNRTAIDDLPDCLDIALVFPDGLEPEAFWATLRDVYVPKLHARGTRLVRTVNISTLLDSDYSNDSSGYIALANHLLSTFVTPYGLDGLDVDVERNLTADELRQASGVFKALGTQLGPASGSGKLLIFDTNLDGSQPLFAAVDTRVDYVLVQSYGRSLDSLQATFDSYKPFISSSQYLIGFSFNEERGARWGDVNTPISTSRAYRYAKWQPESGSKGGIFAYAIDRDGVAAGDDAIQPTDYSVTRTLISAMNP